MRDETREIGRNQILKGPVCLAKAAELSSVGNRKVGKWPFLINYAGSSMEDRKEQIQDQKHKDYLGGCNSPRERWLGSEQRG